MAQSDHTSRRLAPIGELRRMRTQQAFIQAQKQSYVVDGLKELVASTSAEINMLEEEIAKQHRLRVKQFSLDRDQNGAPAHNLTRYDDHISAKKVQIDSTRTALRSHQKELADAATELAKLRLSHARHQARAEQLDSQLRQYQVREAVTQQQRLEIQSDEHRAARRQLASTHGGSK